MAEIIHEHESQRDSNSMSWVVGLIVLLVVVFLLFYYGLPVLNRASAPAVQIPEKVDVNINTPQQQ